MKAYSRLFVFALLAGTLLLPKPALAVFTADEICAPNADPCVISSTISVSDGALLDFGLRDVQIVNAGQLDSGAGGATLRCGSFSASGGTEPGIKARGPSGFGTTNGGFFTIEANRTCSLDSEVLCIADRGCKFGLCNTGVCSGNFARICASDSACDLGICNGQNRCAGATNFACTSDADCQIGTCSVTVCSQNRQRECSTDNECDAGSCDGTTGDITIERKIRADGFEPGGIELRAAGNITILESINASASNTESDGGIIEIESGQGTIQISAALQAVGGGLSSGGEICLFAGEDIISSAVIDAAGGDFDGGSIELDAARDILISNDLSVSSQNGEGFGGEIAGLAGRDIVFSGTNRIQSNGHMSGENFGGDGGSQDYTALRDIIVGPGATFECHGAAPDGSGDTIAMFADGTLTVQGDLLAKAQGLSGAGGAIDLESEGALIISSTSVLDVSGSSDGGGDIDIIGSGDLTLAGMLTSSGSSGGPAGSVFIDSSGTLDINGTISLNGSPLQALNGNIDIEACRMNILSGALIDNNGGFGLTDLTGRERISILSGSAVRNAATGTNRFFYRAPNKPPTIKGIVTPSPTLILTEGLLGCPVCGNAELEQTETCDDGNLVGGDGCSADCQDEDCIAQTPGYPAVPLCDDDDGCTSDTCNDGQCGHETNCDDGIDCTTDSCGIGNVCVNSPNHAACDDGNSCTVDSCSMSTGCTHSFSNGVCNDDIDCTSNDVCFNGTCSGIANCPAEEFCIAETGMCSATTTTTTLAQQCGNGFVEGPETCDDGDTFWMQGQYCSAECGELSCGDADNSGAVTATDALFVLRVAVSLSTCDGCVCDVDSSGSTTAQDALRLLRKAVGIAIELTCSSCPN